MPLLRYFVYVGASLLGLLLIANVALPPVPLPGTLTSATDLPSVRIHSDRKLPEAIVFDTRSTVSSAPVPVLPAPVTVAEAVAPAQPAAATVAEISPKARVREAFAQLPEEATTAAPKPKMAAKSPIRRKVAARPHITGPMMMVAQQPHFGQFATW
jgi:hypothetical protein